EDVVDVLRGRTARGHLLCPGVAPIPKRLRAGLRLILHHRGRARASYHPGTERSGGDDAARRSAAAAEEDYLVVADDLSLPWRIGGRGRERAIALHERGIESAAACGSEAHEEVGMLPDDGHVELRSPRRSP